MFFFTRSSSRGCFCLLHRLTKTWGFLGVGLIASHPLMSSLLPKHLLVFGRTRASAGGAALQYAFLPFCALRVQLPTLADVVLHGGLTGVCVCVYGTCSLPIVFTASTHPLKYPPPPTGLNCPRERAGASVFKEKKAPFVRVSLSSYGKFKRCYEGSADLETN